MRKTIKRILICSAVFVIIAYQIMVLRTGRFFVDYWIRDMLGEYDTNITVTNMSQSRAGTLSAYCNGEYYFYDKAKQAICEYSTGTTIVLTKDMPTHLEMSEKYIYYTTEDALYQCDYSGTEIASHRFYRERLDGLYADDKNVYCESNSAIDTLGYAIYVFRADNVSEAGEFSMLDESWDEATPYYEDGKSGILEHKVKRIRGGWLIATGNPNVIKMKQNDDMVKIYTRNISNGYFGLIADGDNEAVFSHGHSIVGIWDGELYSSEGGIIRMTSPKKWDDYGKDLSPELWTSHTKVDGSQLIVLFEHYRSDDGRASSIGSVGQYVKGHLLYIDLESKKLQYSIPVKKGQVIYMDKSQYAVMKAGKVKFYRVEDGKEVSTYKLKDYKLRKDYYIEQCYDKLFFFCENKLIDVIEV